MRDAVSAYESLAGYYSELFPLSDKARNFLAPMIEQCRAATLPWLDVGAGTGNLLAFLDESGLEVFALEPDAEFAAEAVRRLRVPSERIVPGLLQDLGRHFQSTTFGAVTCLGNVLAHAESREQVREFFRAAADVLTPGGELVVQVVNFDRVLDRQAWEFPVLERVAADGTPLEFERTYEPIGDRLLFRTALRADRVEIRNEAILLPVRRADLETAAAAFAEVRFFGDFGAPWSDSAPATILRCAKRGLR